MKLMYFKEKTKSSFKWIATPILMLISILPMHGETEEEKGMDVTSLIALGLPVVEIETVDGEWPTYDIAEKPEGCWGSGITNATKVPSRMRIYLDKEVVYDSGDYEKGKSGLTIKIRGNSSAITPKKPFKLKLQKKADLLMRGNDDVYKDKDWLLYKDDKNMSLNTMIGLKINELAGMEWTPAFRFANVVINNDYQGVYMLMESVGHNSDCRIDIDKESGYILEYDAYWWNEDVYLDEGLYFKYGPLRYTFKYPDSEDITPEQLAYIQEAVNTMEQSITDGSYPDYIDVESFATWLLAHDILGTFDGGGSNIFIKKYDNTADTKFAMTNLWDFDTIERNNNKWSSEHTMPIFYYNTLFQSQNKTFVRTYVDKWNEVKNTLFSDMDQYLDDFKNSDEALALDASMKLDGQRWGKQLPTVESEVAQAKEWFSERTVWMEEAMLPIIESTEIDLKTSAPIHTEKQLFYNMMGQRVTASTPGILIRNGKKIINAPLAQ